MSDTPNAKEILEAIKAEEERLIAKGMETQVPRISEARLEELAHDPVIRDLIAEAAKSPQDLKLTLQGMEKFVRAAIAQEWGRRLASQELAQRIRQEIRDGKVPEGWVKQGKGWWKVQTKESGGAHE